MNTMYKSPEQMKMPEYLPEYTIQPSTGEPFSVKYEEVRYRYILPRIGEKVEWAVYTLPDKSCMFRHEVSIEREAEVHGLTGLEIEEFTYSSWGDAIGRHREVSQFTDTHSQMLASGLFLRGQDGWEQSTDWDFRRFGIQVEEIRELPNKRWASERMVKATGVVECVENRFCIPEEAVVDYVADIKGCYDVTICGRVFHTIRVIHVQHCARQINGIDEEYIDQNGRVVLVRSFVDCEEDEEVMERYEEWGDGSVPTDEVLLVNGKPFVHSEDTISEYVLKEGGA